MDDDAFSDTLTRFYHITNKEQIQLTKLQIVILFVAFLISLLFIFNTLFPEL